MTRKLVVTDLNWSLFHEPTWHGLPSDPKDWVDIDVDEYIRFQKEVGNNCLFLQGTMFTGYAIYPSKLTPLAPGKGSTIFPRFYEKARADGSMEIWSYMCVGCDVFVAGSRQDWIIPTSRQYLEEGLIGPETPWTEQLCERIYEFLSLYPVDVMMFDWFTYGSLCPDKFHVQPAWFVEKPFKEIIGRKMPKTAEKITPEESLIYKREVLARQFNAIYNTVKQVSPKTKLCFNVPYWEAKEALWEDHVMMEKTDILFAESSDDVVNWLLEKRKPHQDVMTTVIGRPGVGDEGVCDPNTWRKWYDKGCSFYGYVWGMPPNFLPDTRFENDLKIMKQAFREMK